MQIQVSVNAQELSGDLKAIAKNQLPFATAKALTDLAWHLRRKETSKIPKYFETRTKRYKGALKVTRAEKKDFPEQYSMLSVRDEILALGATGGTRPTAGAIPGRNARSLLNPARKTLGPRYFPQKVLGLTDKGVRKRGAARTFKSRTKYKNRPFVFTSKRGPSSGQKVVAVRRSRKRTPIDILYVFAKRKPKMQKRWPFIKNVSEGARRLYQPFFIRSLVRSIQSSKTLR